MKRGALLAVYEVTVDAGFTAPGVDTFIQVDDFTVS